MIKSYLSKFTVAIYIIAFITGVLIASGLNYNYIHDTTTTSSYSEEGCGIALEAYGNQFFNFHKITYFNEDCLNDKTEYNES